MGLGLHVKPRPACEVHPKVSVAALQCVNLAATMRQELNNTVCRRRASEGSDKAGQYAP